MDLKKALLDFIEKKPNSTFADMIKYLKIDDQIQVLTLGKALKQLELSGNVYKDSNNKYNLMDNKPSLVQGRVHFLVSGDCYVSTSDNKKIFVNKNSCKNLLEKDIVVLTNIRKGKDNVLYGDVDKIVKRNKNAITCEVVLYNGRNVVVPYNTNSNTFISLYGNVENKFGVGELILVEFDDEVNEYGYYVKTIGHISDPDIDEISIAVDNGASVEFSEKYYKELERIPTKVEFYDDDESINRIDLRDKNFFTIDGSDTKDIDDAVCIENLPDGGYKLYVSIADVAYYVKDDTEICYEAFRRGTSIYMNDTVIPMFHPKLSNGICSLNENCDRYTKTCEITFSSDGNIVDYEVYNSIIRSKKKMTYEAVNNIILNNIVDKGYEEFKDDLLLMNKLSQLMNNVKDKRGYLSFSSQEIKAKGRGEDIVFLKREQRVAEKIIENFMLAANECIAEFIYYSGIPGIYRIHESPDVDKVKAFLAVLNSMGFKFKNCKSITSNTFLQKVANTLMKSNCKDNSVFLDLLLVNTMERAKYSPVKCRHFGLALNNYTHFTSPIRRYADLQVHKILDMIFKYDYENIDFDEFHNYMGIVAEQCNKRSRAADICERDARMMRMAEYMENHIGETFSGVVTYISPHHVSVKTDDGITGVINLSDFNDDFYIYDKNKNMIQGKKDKVLYKIGSPIEFTVKDASKKNRTVNFSHGEAKKKKSSRNKDKNKVKTKKNKKR